MSGLLCQIEQGSLAGVNQALGLTSKDTAPSIRAYCGRGGRTARIRGMATRAVRAKNMKALR
jgi:hypothetical protein